MSSFPVLASKPPIYVYPLTYSHFTFDSRYNRWPFQCPIISFGKVKLGQLRFQYQLIYSKYLERKRSRNP